MGGRVRGAAVASCKLRLTISSSRYSVDFDDSKEALPAPFYFSLCYISICLLTLSLVMLSLLVLHVHCLLSY